MLQSLEICVSLIILKQQSIELLDNKEFFPAVLNLYYEELKNILRRIEIIFWNRKFPVTMDFCLKTEGEYNVLKTYNKSSHQVIKIFELDK